VEAGLEWAPELVIVATPTALHAEHALAAARRGCHVFVEKPLAHSSAGVWELADEVARRDLISLVGCNMRFHPGPAAVKRLLDSGAIGRVLFARLHAGSYLPEWRPGQDYRESYSAKADE
jgi:predicted dehydrogenase